MSCNLYHLQVQIVVRYVLMLTQWDAATLLRTDTTRENMPGFLPCMEFLTAAFIAVLDLSNVVGLLIQ